jgi:predicted transcriptional regulator
MKSDLNDIEFAYATKEVAEKVGIAKPTVRKYAQMLEEHNYEFIKNGDRRVFVDVDIKAMEKMRISDNIEQTAKELSEKQKENMKRKSDINNDIEKAIHRISPSDTALSIREKETDIAFLETQYDQLLTAFKDMAVEYAATREKVESMEEYTREIASSVREMMKKYEEEKEEKRLFKEKLDLAVDYIQKQEENSDKTEKKGIWKRIFG